MMGIRPHKLWGFVAATLALMIAGTAVRAADIVDEAGFFSADAIEKANREIRNIEKKSGHQIQIETYATVPLGKIDAVAKMNKTERDAFMRNWVKKVANDSHADGTVILITKDPPHIEPWASGKLRDQGFTESDYVKINKAMIDGFRSKNYDKALDQTVKELDAAYSKLGSSAPKRLNAEKEIGAVPQAAHREAPVAAHRNIPAHPVKSAWSSVIFIVIAVLLGIFAISMLSRLFGGGAGYPRPGYGGQPGYGGPGTGGPGFGAPGYGGGGGGFMRSLAGGIFGAMAGNWLYDSLSGRSAHAQDYPVHTGYGSQPQNDDRSSNSQGSDDFTGGGGDFGGGGDSGGGDFGGGGGDFGGGGGDFGGGDSGGGDF